jgi:hypothetical protein
MKVSQGLSSLLEDRACHLHLGCEVLTTIIRESEQSSQTQSITLSKR